MTVQIPACPQTAQDHKDLLAQWSFDTRPILGRFHLWLDDVQTLWTRGEPCAEGLREMSFPNGRIERLLALTAAVTALGTQIYGRFGDGRGERLFYQHVFARFQRAFRVVKVAVGVGTDHHQLHLRII